MREKVQTNTENIDMLGRISTECHKTKTKPITYQLDYSANFKPQ